MKGWDKGLISQLIRMYDTTPIERTKFVCIQKEAILQYVKIEARNIALEDNDSSQSSLSRQAFLNSMIIQWRTYLVSIVNDGLVMSDAKVDECVVTIECKKNLSERRGQ